MEEIIADSSFYICFLDCINDKNSLIKIIKNFKIHISKKILEEIGKSPHFHYIKNEKFNIFSNPNLNLGEALRPFVTEEQIFKGEHEVIVLAYIFNGTGINFWVIIDEKSKRNLVERIVPEISNKLIGTIQLIGLCNNKYNIFNKKESLELLDKISFSNFRIKGELIEEVKKTLK
jgi:hypothetical protein